MAPPRLFDTEWTGDVLVCRCKAAVSSLTDVDVSQELAALVATLAEQDASGAIVDLRPAAWFGSLLLELLRGLWTRLDADGRRLALICVDQVGLDILRLARFDTLWPICPTPEAALDAIRRADSETARTSS